MSRWMNLALLIATVTLLVGCRSGSNAPAAPDQSIADAASGERPNDTLHLVGRGVNTKLSFKATEPGTIYLYDFDTGQRVFSEHLDAKQTFSLDPEAGRATINNQTVTLEHVVNQRDEYRLYFDRQEFK